MGGRSWQDLDDDVICRTVTRAMHRLNGHVVRSSRKAGHRPKLDAIVHVERGRSTGRPHVHALIERPPFWEPVAFAEVVVAAWVAQPFGCKQGLVEELRDVRRCLAYNMKADIKTGGDIVYVHKEEDEFAWWRADWLRDWNA
jgi:hypothetical protein